MDSATYYSLYAEPLLSITTAHIVSLLFGATYVGVLYLSQRARVSFETGQLKGVKGTRDDPSIIKARLLAVSLATLACCFAISLILFARVRHNTWFLSVIFEGTLLRLGLPLALEWPTWATFRAHLVVPVLFLGPLVASGLSGELPLQSRWRWRTHVEERFFSLQGVRNYAIAPLTEEVVFRACVLAVWHMSGMGRKKMIFVAPLTFGLAHVHHGLENFHRGGRTRDAALRAIVSTLFQLAYTTLFGILASFLFLRTGSILPPISAHVFCNIMGMPDPGWEVRRHPKKKNVILVSYALGIFGFILTLWRWTETPGSMYWHGRYLIASSSV